MAAAAGFPPNWVLLEPFVFRRDDDESFPDESKAPIRASGTTSWGADFRIAFALAEPPRISRLYAKLPEPWFPGPKKAHPLAILATHKHLALLRLASKTPTLLLLQDLFIFSSAGENNLKALPPCREPGIDYTRADGRLRFRRRNPNAPPRLLNTARIGLWCGPGQDDFVVTELSLCGNRFAVFADICLLRSSCASSTAHTRSRYCGGRWESMRVEILSTDNPDDDDIWQLCCWQTEAVIPFRQWLCWIDYNRGVLFCDMSKLPTPPTVSFLRFPVDKFPLTSSRMGTANHRYRGVSVVDDGRELKFVNVARQDDIPLGALKPGTGFTITCHTLVLGDGDMAWREDYTVTSGELWDANPPDRLPRGILMFPRVDIDRPHVVHYLYIEFGYVNTNMWTVSIDMSTKTVESFSVYINRKDGLPTDGIRAHDYDLVEWKSMFPSPFLPCEFPKFLRISSLAGRGGDEPMTLQIAAACDYEKKCIVADNSDGNAININPQFAGILVDDEKNKMNSHKFTATGLSSKIVFGGAIMRKKEEKKKPRKYIHVGSMHVEID